MKKLLITGAPRSGTSLLHSLIDAHELIYLKFEEKDWGLTTSMINGLNSALYLLSPHKYKRKEGNNSVRVYFSSPEGALESDRSSKPDSKRDKYEMTGTKMCTPNQIQPIGVKYLCTRGWKIIFIYRDARDSVLSMNRRGNTSIDFASHKWNTAIELQKALESKNNVMTIPFETLLFHEKEVLKKICDFLKIDFQEKMMYGFIDIEKDEYKNESLDESKAFSYKDEENEELMKKIEGLTKENLDYCNKSRESFQKSL